ncbi:hypothetical protein T492DRAFT_32177 [Pavlovales sp. CCMP2436]|nr:hypothetical protein T492DRAFT_32177 [Pavlovales sp. CCMP2436]
MRRATAPATLNARGPGQVPRRDPSAGRGKAPRWGSWPGEGDSSRPRSRPREKRLAVRLSAPKTEFLLAAAQQTPTRLPSRWPARAQPVGSGGAIQVRACLTMVVIWGLRSSPARSRDGR